MSDPQRQSLRAYLRLQCCHKELHKLLKALEEDASDPEVQRRLETVAEILSEAQTLLKTS